MRNQEDDAKAAHMIRFVDAWSHEPRATTQERHVHTYKPKKLANSTGKVDTEIIYMKISWSWGPWGEAKRIKMGESRHSDGVGICLESLLIGTI